jgi:hypothetical protein
MISGLRIAAVGKGLGSTSGRSKISVARRHARRRAASRLQASDLGFAAPDRSAARDHHRSIDLVTKRGWRLLVLARVAHRKPSRQGPVRARATIPHGRRPGHALAYTPPMAESGSILIGLTGGIGSGKSRVADLLRELGAAVECSDAIVRELQAPGGAGLAAIVEAFGRNT